MEERHSNTESESNSLLPIPALLVDNFETEVFAKVFRHYKQKGPNPELTEKAVRFEYRYKEAIDRLRDGQIMLGLFALDPDGYRLVHDKIIADQKVHFKDTESQGGTLDVVYFKSGNALKDSRNKCIDFGKALKTLEALYQRIEAAGTISQKEELSKLHADCYNLWFLSEFKPFQSVPANKRRQYNSAFVPDLFRFVGRSKHAPSAKILADSYNHSRVGFTQYAIRTRKSLNQSEFEALKSLMAQHLPESKRSVFFQDFAKISNLDLEIDIGDGFIWVDGVLFSP